jgi:hypothetical protein
LEIRNCTGDDFEGVLPLLEQLWPGVELERDAIRRTFEACLADEGQALICASSGVLVDGLLLMTVKTASGARARRRTSTCWWSRRRAG